MEAPRGAGPGEGAVVVLAPPALVPEAITAPFASASGCRVRVLPAPAGVRLAARVRHERGRADAVATDGEVAGRLVEHGDVVALGPRLRDLVDRLPKPLQTTVPPPHGGRARFGLAELWSPRLLVYATDRIAAPPTSAAPLYDGSSFAGRVAAAGGPLHIADAALVAEASDPTLGIRDPFELTPPQFRAAVALVRRQRSQVVEYWRTTAAATRAFERRGAVLGDGEPAVVDELDRDRQPFSAVLPSEGATGRTLAWYRLAGAPHPNCLARWLAYVATPPVQAYAARVDAAVPAAPAACLLLPDAYCVEHAGGETGPAQIAFAHLPVRSCAQGADACVPYARWRAAWRRAVAR